MPIILSETLHITRKEFKAHVPKGGEVQLKNFTSPDPVASQRHILQAFVLHCRKKLEGNCFETPIRTNNKVRGINCIACSLFLLFEQKIPQTRNFLSIQINLPVGRDPYFQLLIGSPINKGKLTIPQAFKSSLIH